jgi:hypothetical protein
VSQAPARRASVEDRERAIFRFLQEPERAQSGATVRDIWEAVSERLGDDVSPQAYYKLLERLEATGKLDRLEDAAADGGRRYLVAPLLHPGNAITLDDVYELLDDLEPSYAIARVVDARDYFEEKRANTLRKAAEALLEEDPLELVHEFVLQKVRELDTDLELLHHSDEQAARPRPFADQELEGRVRAQLRELQQLVYRYLGLSREAVDAARTDQLIQGQAALKLNSDALRAELGTRVFGERVIMPIRVAPQTDRERDAWERTSVSGSDSSTHASVMQLTTAQPFVDDAGHQVVTFNNSVVYVHVAPVLRNRFDLPYYSVPMSRSAIDDRGNRGMVLAPFMYRYLSESEYEHMAKCATDVVQWRADELVFLGIARSFAHGALLPRPTVHFRDGTITPQEREFGHYKRQNEYGEMVREGIAHTRTILEKILVSDNPQVFAGAVKVTQQRFFSMLLNWYIAKGSRRKFAASLDPEWDTTRAAHIADNEAMSHLLSTLEDRRDEGVYYVTFAVMRPFHTLTEFFRTPLTHDYDWVEDFQKRRERELATYRAELDNDVPHLATVPDLAEDDFVYLCRKADYVAFYVGHTAGDPPPIAPRYEFLEGLRALDPALAAERVARNQRLVVTALHRTKLALDKDHNFLSRKVLVKIIPYVVYEAHEKGKALGRKLESELRSIVVANLQAIRQARLLNRDVRFQPVKIRDFVRRYSQVLREDHLRDPDSFER